MMKISTMFPIIAMSAAFAHADVVSPSASDLSIFAGGTVSIGDRVRTIGSIGAGSGVSIGHENTVSGDIYATGAFSMNDRSNVSGAITSSSSISAGHDASVSGPMNAATTVWIGARGTYADINAGTSFSADARNWIDGSVSAGTTFWMNSDTVITGNVNYGSSYSAANSASVRGSIATNPSSPGAWIAPSIPDAFTMHSGGSSVWVSEGSSSQINQGAHGAFSTGANTTLHFGSGAYSFDSFYAGHDSTLSFDTSAGDVILYSSNDFTTGDRAVFTTTGSGRVIVNAANGIWIGHDSDVTASFQAINGSVSIGDRVDFEGTLTAGADIWIGHDSSITSTVIPAPSAMALLGLTGFVGASRRRR
jgi:uncharacterized protein (TIGR03382 family)